MSRQGKKRKTPQPTMPRPSSNAEQSNETPTSANVSPILGSASIQQVCQHYTDGNATVGCIGHHTGVLTGQEISKYKIIQEDELEPDCLQATSYDLRIGEGHMVYNPIEKKWVAKWLGDLSPPDGGSIKYERVGSQLNIPRFGMALIQLRETVDLFSCLEDTDQPVMVCGHFVLKLSRVREGLISQQATQVEPGYQGKLFCYLFNQTGDDITLSYGDTSNSRVATIEFQYVSCLSQCDSKIRQDFLTSLPAKHNKYASKPLYCNPRGIKDVRFFDGTNGLPKHGGLSSIDDRLNNAQKEARTGCEKEIKSAGNLRGWTIGLVAIIASLLIFLLQQGIRAEINSTWELIHDKDGKVAAITADAQKSKDEIELLRQEIKAVVSELSSAKVEANTAREALNDLLKKTSSVEGLLDKPKLKKSGTNTPHNNNSIAQKNVPSLAITKNGGTQ